MNYAAFFFLILLLVSCQKEEIPSTDPYAAAKENMIQNHLKARDITDEKVLNAMRRVPRHELVPEPYKSQAYDDHALPIGEGQTISQPYIVALMTQSLSLKGNEKVLEIGTGSGYQATVLAEIVPEVYTIEIIPELANRAKKDLERLGYKNIHIKMGDGYEGWPEYAPFDAILITAAVDHIPQPLVEQLKEEGRIVLPLITAEDYEILTIGTKKQGKVETQPITGVRFVSMVGKAEIN